MHIMLQSHARTYTARAVTRQRACRSEPYLHGVIIVFVIVMILFTIRQEWQLVWSCRQLQAQ